MVSKTCRSFTARATQTWPSSLYSGISLVVTPRNDTPDLGGDFIRAEHEVLNRGVAVDRRAIDALDQQPGGVQFGGTNGFERLLWLGLLPDGRQFQFLLCGLGGRPTNRGQTTESQRHDHYGPCVLHR
jgi:hypothetical protein